MNFYQRVYRIVKTIPRGQVMTYGQIAAMISSPRAARVVGFAMRAAIDKEIPWQRVINSHGMISIVNPAATKQLQAARLRADGVAVTEKQGNYYVDLKTYLYHP